MKEKLKTLLLIVLFGTSLFLSREFWAGSTYSDYVQASEEENLVFENNIVRPYKFLINFSNKNHTVIYGQDNIWHLSKPYIIQALDSKNSKITNISKKDYNKLLNKSSLLLNFNTESSTYILSESLDFELNNLMAKKVPTFKSILISLLEEPFIVLESEGVYKKIYNFDYDYKDLEEYLYRIKEKGEFTNYYAIKESLNVNSNLFIPYNLNENIPDLYLKDELDIRNLENIRDFSKKFFNKDIDYMREIVEKDNSVLHIYNEEVLKYKPDGLVEYFNPLEENVLERNLSLSLKTAIKFLHNKYLMSEDIYLSNIEEIKCKGNLGYRFTFKYYINNLEVISKENSRDYMEIDVFNNYIQSFKKNTRYIVRKEDKLEDAISLLDIININYETFEKDYLLKENESLEDDLRVEKVISSIDSVGLYYFEDLVEEGQVLLKPVWAVNIQDYVYLLDIYSGELLDKKKKV